LQTRLFKIESYEKLDADAAEETESLVEAGNIMVGTFRVSRNYFYLKPGETYAYDASIPYIHPKSFLPASHAVMVIGHGKQPPTTTAEGTSEAACWPRHVNFQNSYGRRFGVNGFGRLARRSLRQLYKITVPELPQP
jgi:senataxin